MRGTSRASLAAGEERLETLLTAPGAQPSAIAEELFGVTGVLADVAGARRALTDPSRTGADKAALVERLFAGRLSAATVDLLTGLVRGRWARALDLTDSVEHLAVSATLAGAEVAGRLDDVEDQLFRFARTVSGDAGLRDAFSTRTEGAGRKAALVQSLLAGRAAPEAVRLAVQAAIRPRGMRTEQVLEAYVTAAAQRRSRLVAHVVAARPLQPAHRARLAAALQRRYGRPMRLNVDVDPGVVGGLRVQVSGELVDATMVARLDEARRRLAG